MLTLVLGGARSGKSRYAASLCAEAENVVFVATADAAGDREMAARVARHRAERPAHWTTIESPLDLARPVERVPGESIVLVDCVTLWLANAMYRWREKRREEREQLVLEEVSRLVGASAGRTVVAVTNDVGSGIVPGTAVGREFRDLQGTMNQALAAAADRVVLLVAGLPQQLKG